MNILGFSDQELMDIGISMAIILLTLILARPILSFILDRIIKRVTKATKSKLDDLIIEAVKGPSFWLILIIAFQIALDRLDFITASFDFNLEDLYFTLYIIVSFILTWRLVNNLIEWYGKEVAPRTDSALDDQLIPFLRRVVLILLSVIVAIIVLGRFNVEVTAIRQRNIRSQFPEPETRVQEGDVIVLRGVQESLALAEMFLLQG